MTRYAQHVASTPQTEQAHPDQRKNNAGGFSFTLDCWKRLDRFLVLGAEGGTYYAGERKLTRDNAGVIAECLAADGARTVKRIAEVSDSGRAPKNDPAIFALALAAAHADPQTRALALTALPVVCRTGTHLFHFAASVNALRGWGRSLRSAIARWYLDKPAKDVAYQALKYQQRDGWSHRDLLRLSHVDGRGLLATPAHNAVFRWIVGAELGAREVKGRTVYPSIVGAELPAMLGAYGELTRAEKPRDVAALIERHGFTHEMIPTAHKNAPEVWDALLARGMPMTAMIRNLGKMSAVGVVGSLSTGAGKVVAALGDRDALRKARVHPISVLSALRVYAQGHGERGSLTWTPTPQIVDALNEAFYLAFDTIVPTGKAVMLALDVSASMASAGVNGIPGLTARDVSAAMAMATARTERDYMVFGFSNRFMPLTISPKQRLDDVVRSISNLPFEGTDCALPMRYALEHDLGLDAFAVYTDNETWAGIEHPHVSLERYRQKSGRAAKLIVCGTAATEFTIANPHDPGMLDVVGFSSDCPALIADFTREG